MDMAGDIALFNEADETEGEPVLEVGGVSGVVYCAGVGCGCSIVCSMMAIC